MSAQRQILLGHFIPPQLLATAFKCSPSTQSLTNSRIGESHRSNKKINTPVKRKSTSIKEWRKCMVHFAPSSPAPLSPTSSVPPIPGTDAQNEGILNNKAKPIGEWHNKSANFTYPTAHSTSPSSTTSSSSEQHNVQKCTCFEDDTDGPLPSPPKSLFDRPIEFHPDYVDGYFDDDFVYRPYPESK
ncbi:unnamed protein product [Caenorhabditis bovis]|uniref:Uncharacterized protein n=1 Tax=Caenorhabditis bovis TaxID=2654633 RepID=A0A8S1ETL2_9PELO|nr:unnamed protein product [Caenorhabditis bovis]